MSEGNNNLASAQFDALKTKSLSPSGTNEGGGSIAASLKDTAPHTEGQQAPHSLAYMEGNRLSSDWPFATHAVKPHAGYSAITSSSQFGAERKEAPVFHGEDREE